MSNSSTFSLIVKIAAGGLALALVLLILGTTSATDPTTSILIIAGVVGLFSAILMGKNIWWLLVFAAATSFGWAKMPAVMLISAVVFPFLCALAIIGRINLKWSKLWFLDIAVLVYVLLFVNSYICHPVSIGALGLLGVEADTLGGADFVVLFFAILTYISFSSIRTNLQELDKIFGWSVWVVVAFILFKFARGLIEFSSGKAGQAQQLSLEESRESSFCLSSTLLTIFILCRYSIKNLFFSFWRIPLLIMCVFGSLMDGGRIASASYIASCSLVFFFKKKFGILVICGIAGYGTLLMLSKYDFVKESFPHGVQRSLSFIPGVDVNPRFSGQNTANWRYILWNMAFDKNKGYIRNRMWGDGFGVERKNIKAQNIILSRGGIYGQSDIEFFALNGVWHNGAITAIHRLGYIGLGATICLMICMFYVFYRASRSIINRPNGYIASYIFIPLCSVFTVWGLSHFTLTKILSAIAYAGLAKLIYTTALREKAIEPLWTRRHYVPLMLRERMSLQRD